MMEIDIGSIREHGQNLGRCETAEKVKAILDSKKPGPKTEVEKKILKLVTEIITRARAAIESR